MTPSVDQIERDGSQVWSPDEVSEVAGWRLASNGGFTRRLNCATTTGDADTSPGTGEAIRQWLADRGNPMTVRITPLVATDIQRAAAEAWSLVCCDPTPVLLAPVGRVAGSTTHEEVAISLPAPDASEFVDDLFALNGRPVWAKQQWRRMVARLRGPAVGLWLPGIATGFVAVVGPIAFVYSVAVHPAHRRAGHGARIMAAAHAWAAGQGAEWVTLQVQASNEAGRGLYADLGYKERYRYHYLQGGC